MQATTIPPYRTEHPGGGAYAVPAAGLVPAPPVIHQWPDELPPPPRPPSPWRWLYVPGSFVIALAVADPDASIGPRIGYALGTLACTAVVAVLFYIWRASTRPAIPATTFILTFLTTGLILLGKEDDVETQTQALSQSADLFALGGVYATMDEDPPEGVDARWVWASRKALEDVAAWYQERADARGIIPGRAPEGWITAAYIADAGEYPDVRRYFTDYRAYLAEADSSTLPVYFDRLRDRLRQAGFSAADAKPFMATPQVGAAAALQARQEEFRLAAQIADSALAFHALLVRADPRAHYDPEEDKAGFERDAERTRARALDQEIDVLTHRLENLRDPYRARLKARRHGAD
jgi:hypothetical protein